MSAIVLDGKALAKSLRSEVAEGSEALARSFGRGPGLAVVLVGDNPASGVYVRSKTKNARKCGFEVVDVHLGESASDRELRAVLEGLNSDDSVDGILLQLPLPAGLNEYEALSTIDPRKDVDGLHPENQGKLLRGAECLRPCTPEGCLVLIDAARALMGLSSDISGLRAVVVGRSVLVGKPLALMLLERHATVTQCHSRTVDLKSEVARADIVIAAVGQSRLITSDYIKPGAIVIDVGINRTEDKKLVGDVDFESVVDVAGAITPVPGGVGPMTIAMLLRNTLDAALARVRSL